MARRTKNAIIFGPLMQLVFFFAIASTHLDRVSFYVLFLVFLFIQIQAYRDSNPDEHVLDLEDFGVDTLGPQAVTGLLLALVVASPLIAVGLLDRRLVVPSPSEVGFQVLLVGLVETIYLVVWIRTVWWGDVPVGKYLWPLAFPFVHSEVRDAWLAGQFPLSSFLAFGQIFVFAVLFELVYLERESSSDYALWFGMGATWIFHVGVNLAILAFPTTVYGFTILPAAIAGTAAIAGPALLILFLPFLGRWNPWHRKRTTTSC